MTDDEILEPAIRQAVAEAVGDPIEAVKSVKAWIETRTAGDFAQIFEELHVRLVLLPPETREKFLAILKSGPGFFERVDPRENPAARAATLQTANEVLREALCPVDADGMRGLRYAPSG